MARLKVKRRRLNAPRTSSVFPALAVRKIEMARLKVKRHRLNAPRISPEEWQRHEGLIRLLHQERYTQMQALEILRGRCESRGCSFRPTFDQYTTQLKVWQLYVYHRRSLRDISNELSIHLSHSVLGEDTEMHNPSTGGYGTPSGRPMNALTSPRAVEGSTLHSNSFDDHNHANIARDRFPDIVENRENVKIGTGLPSPPVLQCTTLAQPSNSSEFELLLDVDILASDTLPLLLLEPFELFSAAWTCFGPYYAIESHLALAEACSCFQRAAISDEHQSNIAAFRNTLFLMERQSGLALLLQLYLIDPQMIRDTSIVRDSLVKLVRSEQDSLESQSCRSAYDLHISIHPHLRTLSNTLLLCLDLDLLQSTMSPYLPEWCLSPPMQTPSFVQPRLVLLPVFMDPSSLGRTLDWWASTVYAASLYFLDGIDGPVVPQPLMKAQLTSFCCESLVDPPALESALARKGLQGVYLPTFNTSMRLDCERGSPHLSLPQVVEVLVSAFDNDSSEQVYPVDWWRQIYDQANIAKVSSRSCFRDLFNYYCFSVRDQKPRCTRFGMDLEETLFTWCKKKLISGTTVVGSSPATDDGSFKKSNDGRSNDGRSPASRGPMPTRKLAPTKSPATPTVILPWQQPLALTTYERSAELLDELSSTASSDARANWDLALRIRDGKHASKSLRSIAESSASRDSHSTWSFSRVTGMARAPPMSDLTEDALLI